MFGARSAQRAVPRSQRRKKIPRPSLFLSARTGGGGGGPPRDGNRAGTKELRVGASGVNGNGSAPNAGAAVTLAARDAAQFPLVGATTEL